MDISYIIRSMLKPIILGMLILSATAARAQIRIWADTDERAPSVTLTPYLPATGDKFCKPLQVNCVTECLITCTLKSYITLC